MSGDLDDEQGVQLLLSTLEHDAARLHESLLSSFNEAEKSAKDALRDVLWVIYPHADSLDIAASEDVVSDRSAAMLVDGLRVRGFKIIKSEH